MRYDRHDTKEWVDIDNWLRVKSGLIFLSVIKPYYTVAPFLASIIAIISLTWFPLSVTHHPPPSILYLIYVRQHL